MKTFLFYLLVVIVGCNDIEHADKSCIDNMEKYDGERQIEFKPNCVDYTLFATNVIIQNGHNSRVRLGKMIDKDGTHVQSQIDIDNKWYWANILIEIHGEWVPLHDLKIRIVEGEQDSWFTPSETYSIEEARHEWRRP